MIARIALNALAMLLLPFLLAGVINRVKALWSGRKGPPLWQTAYDALRLLRKAPVYSVTTTAVFRVAPWVFVATAIASATLTPLTGGQPIASFDFDFVWFAYVWGLGRIAMMLAALDTGSSFEGMGVAREATFSTLLEPALFLVFGALCLSGGVHTLHDALTLRSSLGGALAVVWFCSLVALFVVVQVESARMPVDDPTTHLELTMIHEVMILDHSGPDLAAIQYGAALKLFVGVSMLAQLLNPNFSGAPLARAVIHVALCAGIAALIGTVEALVARLKLRSVPIYIMSAVITAAVALLATAWRSGAVR